MTLIQNLLRISSLFGTKPGYPPLTLYRGCYETKLITADVKACVSAIRYRTKADSMVAYRKMLVRSYEVYSIQHSSEAQVMLQALGDGFGIYTESTEVERSRRAG